MYKGSGLSLKYGTIDAYIGRMSKEPEEHRKFLKAVRVYVQSLNERPGESRKRLMEAARPPGPHSIVSVRSQGKQMGPVAGWARE